MPELSIDHTDISSEDMLTYRAIDTDRVAKTSRGFSKSVIYLGFKAQVVDTVVYNIPSKRKDIYQSAQSARENSPSSILALVSFRSQLMNAIHGVLVVILGPILDSEK
jgi:hypothetical protein